MEGGLPRSQGPPPPHTHTESDTPRTLKVIAVSMMQRCPRHQAHGNVISVKGKKPGLVWLAFQQRVHKQLLLIGGNGAHFLSVAFCLVLMWIMTHCRK